MNKKYKNINAVKFLEKFQEQNTDDLKENIDAAIKVGMKGFVYHQNIQELEKYIENIL